MTTFTTDDRLHAEKDGSFTIDCRPKPLTDEQAFEVIKEVMGITYFGSMFRNEELKLVRAIEKAHGIG